MSWLSKGICMRDLSAVAWRVHRAAAHCQRLTAKGIGVQGWSGLNRTRRHGPDELSRSRRPSRVHPLWLSIRPSLWARWWWKIVGGRAALLRSVVAVHVRRRNRRERRLRRRAILLTGSYGRASRGVLWSRRRTSHCCGSALRHGQARGHGLAARTRRSSTKDVTEGGVSLSRGCWRYPRPAIMGALRSVIICHDASLSRSSAESVRHPAARRPASRPCYNSLIYHNHRSVSSCRLSQRGGVGAIAGASGGGRREPLARRFGGSTAEGERVSAAGQIASDGAQRGRREVRCGGIKRRGRAHSGRR